MALATNFQGGIVPVSPNGDPAIPRRAAPPGRRWSNRRGLEVPAALSQIKKPRVGAFFIWRRGRESKTQLANPLKIKAFELRT